MPTTLPPDPGKSWKSADFEPSVQVEISFIPDHWILFVAPAIFPVTKKSLITPDTLNNGGLPSVAIVDKFAKFVDVPIK